jgi:transcription elongation factor GreB
MRAVSRAFVKEDSAELPLVVPRAPLPEGVPNYCTARGLRALTEERAALGQQRPTADGSAGATAQASYQARLAALEARIQSAVVLDAATLPQDEVRFSAAVTLRSDDGQRRHYRIVGVDEADPASGRIAFTAPVARELMGKRLGDWVTLRAGQGEVDCEITAIDYAQE